MGQTKTDNNKNIVTAEKGINANVVLNGRRMSRIAIRIEMLCKYLVAIQS
jgi:hypothetical protein